VSPTAGTIIAGRYEILELIAEGGMSTVYRARRHPDGGIVALKILRDQYAADREFLERFAHAHGRPPNLAALAVYAVAVYATAWLMLRKRVG